MTRTRITLFAIAAGVAVLLAYACGRSPAAGTAATATIQSLMQTRGLSEENVTAALKTYMPTGQKDEYYIFASGGHSGQLLVIGVPSMRLLKVVAVFTPEPWQGYGYGDQTSVLLRSGDRGGKELNWADVHHPALSETNGEYDGKFIFVGDKANARLALVSLADFSTKQIVYSDVMQSNHGGAFVTPNTEYVIEGSQYPAPLGGRYADVADYEKEYRGAVVLWKFDRDAGRIDPARSFAIELPPYMQDLADSGKAASDGYIFLNSFNSEMAYGGNQEGRPPLESGASQNDMDYLHVVDWRKAEQVADAGKVEKVGNTRVIRLQTAIEEGLLHFVGQPKSPHGVDISPDGKDIVVSGKLDTHATVYSIDKLKSLIAAKKYAGRDPFGVPILPFEESIRGQAEIGLGPLHTQFDADGNAYTSVFIESVVAKWSLKDLKLIEKLPVHYNIGHLVVAEGDTVSPDGRYLVAMNKWALDRFAEVGPLLPQNFQLVDVTGDKMQLLYDMPIGVGEPHYAQMIKADKLKTITAYTPAGIDPITDKADPHSFATGEEGHTRKADGVHVNMRVVRSQFTPDTIRVKKGEVVHLHLTNVEQAHDATHGFAIGSHNINVSLEPGEHANVTFTADRAGVFPFYCTEFCSALHLEMAGYLLVEP